MSLMRMEDVGLVKQNLEWQIARTWYAMRFVACPYKVPGIRPAKNARVQYDRVEIPMDPGRRW